MLTLDASTTTFSPAPAGLFFFASCADGPVDKIISDACPVVKLGPIPTKRR
jgi:hypothetical protein